MFNSSSIVALAGNQWIYNINLNQMKQETINLIKSMTKQGFLVIVDPGKLKGEDRAIIKVMAWKDTDNKAMLPTYSAPKNHF